MAMSPKILSKIISKYKKFSVVSVRSESACMKGVFITAEYGRFGNNVKQLRNALDVAKLIGVDFICLQSAAFKVWMPNFHEIEYHGVRLRRVEDAQALPSGTWLCSDFFDISLFKFSHQCSNDIWFSRFLKYIIDFRNTKKLAIHIRSGDIFVERPHSAYIQPSFEYYKLAVIDSLRWLAVEEINLFCEDYKNPVSLKVVDYLSEIGIHFVVHRGDFDICVSEMRLSDCVIFGFGSFSIPFLYSSTSLTSVYFPSYELNALKLAYSLGLNPRCIDLYDYIEVGAWANTVDQRDLMITHSNCSPVYFFDGKLNLDRLDFDRC